MRVWSWGAGRRYLRGKESGSFASVPAAGLDPQWHAGAWVSMQPLWPVRWPGGVLPKLTKIRISGVARVTKNTQDFNKRVNSPETEPSKLNNLPALLAQERATSASDIVTPMILERLASGRKASFKERKKEMKSENLSINLPSCQRCLF